jgi:hypothetical protein
MKSTRLFSVGSAILAFILLSCTQSVSSGNKKDLSVKFVKNEPAGKVDILIGGKLITSYCWPENVYKPILYPVYSIRGTEITRGFPLRPRAGERNDHIHQVGIWFNYGNVNGIDFWGNGSEGRKSENGGVIKHRGIKELKDGQGEGVMTIDASWQDPAGKELLAEKTEFHIIAKDTYYIIDRITTLTATGNTVIMKDTKEGMYAIRVARQLELPSSDDVKLLDGSGKPGSETAKENRCVTGNYRSSEGITGDAVWSTRARWMNLSGTIGNENISITICDHPDNISYPTYWHARGYGLFSANPLGGNDFTKGEKVVNFSIPAGESVIFRYRMIINSGQALSEEDLNLLADEFAEKY